MLTCTYVLSRVHNIYIYIYIYIYYGHLILYTSQFVIRTYVKCTSAGWYQKINDDDKILDLKYRYTVNFSQQIVLIKDTIEKTSIISTKNLVPTDFTNTF